MPNAKEKTIELLKTHQLANLATLTLDGRPWTRFVMIKSNDQFQLRSAVSLKSRKVAQIKQHPEVHLAFGVHDPRDMIHPYVQIQGLAHFTSDPTEKERYWFDMLAHVFSGPNDPNYAVLIVEPYRVEFNAPGQAPEIWEK